MGCFDSAIFKCPVCGNQIGIQSKAGDCVLADYQAQAVPAEIAADINGRLVTCNSCYETFTVRSYVPLAFISMYLEQS